MKLRKTWLVSGILLTLTGSAMATAIVPHTAPIPTPSSVKHKPYSIDLRAGYAFGSHSYNGRVQVYHTWNNGVYARFEDNTKDGTDQFHAPNTNYDEVEVGKTIHVNPKLSYMFGGVLHWGGSSNSVASIRPYIKLSYQWTPDFGSALRYRYDYNLSRSNYNNSYLKGNQGRASEHRFDLFLYYNLNHVWNISDMVTYYVYQNNKFTYSNGKDHNWENSLTLKYIQDKSIQPYIQWSYTGDTASHNGKVHLKENKLFIGVTMNFY